MADRCTFHSARATHSILESLVRGDDWTIADVEAEYGVSYPQSRAYLGLLEELYALETYWQDGTKHWTWPHGPGVFAPAASHEED